ncbi:hypothetical protein ACFLXI_08385, partial [Chloroflexota bacterium]
SGTMPLWRARELAIVGRPSSAVYSVRINSTKGSISDEDPDHDNDHGAWRGGSVCCACGGRKLSFKDQRCRSRKGHQAVVLKRVCLRTNARRCPSRITC